MNEFILLVQLFTAPIVIAFYVAEGCNIFAMVKAVR